MYEKQEEIGFSNVEIGKEYEKSDPTLWGICARSEDAVVERPVKGPRKKRRKSSSKAFARDKWTY